MTADSRTVPVDRERPPWYAVALERRPQLVSLARRVLRHAAEAEEVADDALARLVERAREDLPKDVGGWLHRTTLRIAIDRARYWIRRQRPEWLYSARARSALPTPSEELERREARESVWRAIFDLPARQREVIILRDLEERTYAEVASVLEIAEATARAHAHAAREELRRRLA